MTGSVEISEYAVICGCGEILPQSSEEGAIAVMQRWNSREIAQRHGVCRVAYRRVITTDWRPLS